MNGQSGFPGKPAGSLLMMVVLLLALLVIDIVLFGHVCFVRATSHDAFTSVFVVVSSFP